MMAVPREVKIRADLGFVRYAVRESVSVGLVAAVVISDGLCEEVGLDIHRPAFERVRRWNVKDRGLRISGRREGEHERTAQEKSFCVHQRLSYGTLDFLKPGQCCCRRAAVLRLS